MLDLSAWLSEKGCTLAAMEATGVYWKPVWHILADGEFELILANAMQVNFTDPGGGLVVSDLTPRAGRRSSVKPVKAIAGEAHAPDACSVRANVALGCGLLVG